MEHKTVSSRDAAEVCSNCTGCWLSNPPLTQRSGLQGHYAWIPGSHRPRWGRRTMRATTRVHARQPPHLRSRR
eukprot:scaffold202070_cov33-Tisochrysis_lutea.AAC.3